MIITIPEAAKDRFIKMCHEAHEAETDKDFQLRCSRCEAYSLAIKDICGDETWYLIVSEADLSFSPDIPSCAGIPIYYKAQHIENQ